MDSQSKLNFTVTVAVGKKRLSKKLIPSEDKSCFDPTVLEQFSEKDDLKIKFESGNSQDRLFLGDLEQMAEGDSRIYLQKEVNEICLRGLMPKVYGFWVESAGKIFNYAFEITLKNGMSDSRWFDMRNKIIQKVVGATNYHKLLYGLSDQKLLGSQSDEAKLGFILQDYKKLNAAIHEFIDRPRFTVDKDYQWEHDNRDYRIDANSIKESIQHPDKIRKVYTPHNTLDYNIKANQYIKYILEDFRKLVIRRKTNLKDQPAKTLAIKDRFQQINHELAKLQSLIDEALMSDVLEQVDSHKSNLIPKTLILNPVYRAIFKEYQETEKQKLILEEFRKSHAEWNSTNELYELWAYFNLVDELIKKGWKQVRQSSLEKFKWDELKDDEKPILTTLTSGGQVLKVTYHKRINNILDPGQSPNEEGVFATTYHYKPDIFLELLNGKESLGLIVLDTKYKPLRNILYDPHLGKKERTAGDIDQLLSYKYALHKKDHQSGVQFPAIISVYGLLPDDQNTDDKNQQTTTERRKLLELLGIKIRKFNTEEDDLIEELESDIEHRLQLRK